jgi:t-SNARE complex subunit (syntaxin)
VPFISTTMSSFNAHTIRAGLRKTTPGRKKRARVVLLLLFVLVVVVLVVLAVFQRVRI